MKTPETANPARYIVNGVEKDFEAGASVTDAAVLDILSRGDFPPDAPAADPPIVLPEGGGSDLPEVSDSDNGKFLGVKSGKWGKVDAPSGDILLCEMNPSTYTATMTSSEIAAAEAAGKNVMLVLVEADGSKIAGGFFHESGGDAYASAMYVDYSDSQLVHISVQIENDFADAETHIFTLTAEE